MEINIDIDDIVAAISPTEFMELCEKYDILTEFTADEILDGIETSEIVENVVRQPDFDVFYMLEEWFSFARKGDIEGVIEWLEAYGYEVTKNK